MSNVAYRVVLVRPSSEPFLIMVLTSLFVALLVAAAFASFVDLRGKNGHRASARFDAPVGSTPLVSALERAR